MEWTDDAIVIQLRPHGETGAILEALTREHGRHLGLVHGGASSKRRAMLQPGNRIHAAWRARIPEHLGHFTAELSRARAGAMFESRAALAGLNAFSAIASGVLPEREPHEAAYLGADALLEAMSGNPLQDWLPLFVRWELGLLDELGFGLDLESCAATGSGDHLLYVSPRSGRAVSAGAGEPYRDRLLHLPPFLRGEATSVPLAESLAGLTLTAHFLDQFVLTPHGKTLPEARRRLAAVATRG